MKNKKILIYIFLILLFLSVGILLLKSKFNSQTGMIGKQIYKASASDLITCDANYKNLNINMDIDNTKGTENIKYVIKNPNNQIVTTGEVLAKDKKDITKEFAGIKGDWRFEFSKKDSESEYSYRINFTGDNKQLH